jgi:hypothetical protein
VFRNPAGCMTAYRGVGYVTIGLARLRDVWHEMSGFSWQQVCRLHPDRDGGFRMGGRFPRRGFHPPIFPTPS